MKEYKYESPITNGYTRVKISKSKLQKLIPNRKVDWKVNPRVYTKDDSYIVEWLPSKLSICLALSLLPVLILLYGVMNWRETYGEVIGHCRYYKYGSFSSDYSASSPEFVRRLYE